MISYTCRSWTHQEAAQEQELRGCVMPDAGGGNRRDNHCHTHTHWWLLSCHENISLTVDIHIHHIHVYNYACCISFISLNWIEMMDSPSQLHGLHRWMAPVRRCMRWCLSFDILTFFGATSQHLGSKIETKHGNLCYIVRISSLYCIVDFYVFKTTCYVWSIVYDLKRDLQHFTDIPSPIHFVLVETWLSKQQWYWSHIAVW